MRKFLKNKKFIKNNSQTRDFYFRDQLSTTLFTFFLKALTISGSARSAGFIENFARKSSDDEMNRQYHLHYHYLIGFFPIMKMFSHARKFILKKTEREDDIGTATISSDFSEKIMQLNCFLTTITFV